MSKKSTFALFFGSRGTFPEKLITQARSEMSETLKTLGHETLMLDAKAAGLGATPSEANSPRSTFCGSTASSSPTSTGTTTTAPKRKNAFSSTATRFRKA